MNVQTMRKTECESCLHEVCLTSGPNCLLEQPHNAGGGDRLGASVLLHCPIT